jgi:Bor protein
MKRAALALLVLATAGCYHVTVDTGRTPSGETISVPWAHSFVAGLVPPETVETAARCPDGVARVETQHSFMNMLAAVLTASIYTPVTIDVACASSGAEEAGAAAEPDEVIETTAARLDDAILQAALRSWELGGLPVTLRVIATL